MNVDVAWKSERGLVRRDNQDSVLCAEDAGLFAVADGMGGSEEGGAASRMVCEELARGASAWKSGRSAADISRSVSAANSRIFSYVREHGLRQMGSTVALLALGERPVGHGTIGHVGDSRVYRVRNGVAELLTRDHSVGAELEAKVGKGAGRGFSARSNPLAHVLTRAVGTKADVELEWRNVDIAAGDRFVLCSDGVHDVVEAEELGGLVAAGDVGNAADSLERTVVSRGAPDNYSFVIVEIGGAE